MKSHSEVASIKPRAFCSGAKRNKSQIPNSTPSKSETVAQSTNYLA